MKKLLALDFDDTLVETSAKLSAPCSGYSDEDDFDACLINAFYTQQDAVFNAPVKKKVLDAAIREIEKGTEVVIITARSTFPAHKTIEMVQNVFGGTDVHEKVFIASGPREKSLTLAAIIVEHEFDEVIVVDDKVRNFDMLSDMIQRVKKVSGKEGKVNPTVLVMHPDVFVEVWNGRA